MKVYIVAGSFCDDWWIEGDAAFTTEAGAAAWLEHRVRIDAAERTHLGVTDLELDPPIPSPPEAP